MEKSELNIKSEKIKLAREELLMLRQVLFNSRWNGDEWQKVITPLINKLAKMIEISDEKKRIR